MRFLPATIGLIIMLSINITHAQSWQSIKQFKIDSRDGASINFIETDPNGDLIVGGTFYSKFTTDSRTYNTYDGVGAFVLKLNDNNDIVWEHVWQGDNSMFDNTGLTGDIDSDGNIYVGLSGVYQTATYVIDPALDDRMIKINNEGSILSTQSFSNSTVLIVDLEVENGQIATLLKGFNYTFNTVPNLSATNEDSYTLANYDLLWIQKYQVSINGNGLTLSDIDLASTGETVAIGSYNQELTLLDTTLTVVRDNGKHDLIVIELDANGAKSRVRSYGESGYEFGKGIHFNSLGDWIINGQKEYNLLGTNYLLRTSRFIARIVNDESLKVGRNLGDVVSTFTRVPMKEQIVLNSVDEVFFTDTYSMLIGDYGYSANSTGLDDALVGKMSDNYLSGQWILTMTGEASDQMTTAIGLDENELPVVGGVYNSTMNYDINKSHSGSSEALFILRTFDNYRPTIAYYTPGSLEEEIPYEKELVLTDLDADTLYVSTTGVLPQGLIFEYLENKKILISGAPIQGTEGEYTFSITAHDGYSSVTKELIYQVKGPNTDFESPFINSSDPILFSGYLRVTDPIITLVFNEEIDTETFFV